MEKKNKNNVEVFFRFLKENNAYKQFLVALPKYKYIYYVCNHIKKDIPMTFSYLIAISNTLEKADYWLQLKNLWAQNILNSSVDS